MFNATIEVLAWVTDSRRPWEVLITFPDGRRVFAYRPAFGSDRDYWTVSRLS